ncbi:LPS export ABC transporter periplasmic protein LptC [Galbibacter pacificus]|uniref:LPS export ABC transporter periplasmic protein LptC n=1 Tax=Galbibacter pacificus TaxID=2996052 RepID=A0ABT6FW59_9FLAO|nr:LPS export ABC transporter periplasmic protein LptC [Galbibacter pacificus]MDG3584055.1 LPS export ABC transporter periplasmic protein LptC [Galbibacter pacificus]MDG3587509.1 LPS export ABC transporter periplasmic protein LptC [Galbibacter pacificus]
MQQKLKYRLLNIVTVIAVTMFFSCEGNLKEVQKMTAQNKMPVGVAEDFVLKYTDSTKLKAVVSGPLYEDYTNQTFPFQEFPKGVHVVFYDDSNQKSTITAKYAIFYSKSDLVDMKGDVVLKTYDGKQLLADQLFWDQKNQWIFTEGPYTFNSPDLNMTGIGIDFNKEFTVVNSHGNSGTAVVKEETKTEEAPKTE